MLVLADRALVNWLFLGKKSSSQEECNATENAWAGIRALQACEIISYNIYLERMLFIFHLCNPHGVWAQKKKINYLHINFLPFCHILILFNSRYEIIIIVTLPGNPVKKAAGIMCKFVRLYLLFIDSIFSYYGCYVEWMHLSVFVAVVFFF